MTFTLSDASKLDELENNPYLDFYDGLETGYFQQSSGVNTYYVFSHNPNTKACIVVFPGRAESCIKYAEIIYELTENGFSVFAIDHQGQGLSSRLGASEQVGYVENFGDYIEDAHHAIEQCLLPLLAKHQQQDISLHLLAHSMGGAIASLYLQKYSDTFKSAVLSAPMIGINVPFLPESVGLLVARLARKINAMRGRRKDYMLGQHAYQEQVFEKNNLTTCRARYKFMTYVLKQFPKTQLGGISPEWLITAISAMRQARAKVNDISVPCMIFMAMGEKIVDNREIEPFANNCKNATLVKVDDAEHEILFEQDHIRKPVLNSILNFFTNGKSAC